ncbi:heme exporter protein CcmD [Falsirhodobacter deserti]|uniref:heme exporter protein CcmD n=1 Tax=Falsirhodobacter deserti TaxID=1365611 RepID=UPI000FE3E6E6|nr:heme exporter protein CcmD [Falsirhodobacter deserti]
MLPELGKYAATVLGAYALAILLIVGLVVLSLRQATRMRDRLRDVEERVKE